MIERRGVFSTVVATSNDNLQEKWRCPCCRSFVVSAFISPAAPPPFRAIAAS